MYIKRWKLVQNSLWSISFVHLKEIVIFIISSYDSFPLNNQEEKSSSIKTQKRACKFFIPRKKNKIELYVLMGDDFVLVLFPMMAPLILSTFSTTNLHNFHSIWCSIWCPLNTMQDSGCYISLSNSQLLSSPCPPPLLCVESIKFTIPTLFHIKSRMRSMPSFKN